MHYNTHHYTLHTAHCTPTPIANVPKSLYCNEKTSVFQLTVEPTTVNMQMVGGGTDETRCVEVPTTQHASDPFIFIFGRSILWLTLEFRKKYKEMHGSLKLCL